MLVPYVLRLVPDELAEGRLVGEVEAVSSGERRAIHGAEELLGFCAESYRSMSPGRRVADKTAEG